MPHRQLPLLALLFCCLAACTPSRRGGGGDDDDSASPDFGSSYSGTVSGVIQINGDPADNCEGPIELTVSDEELAGTGNCRFPTAGEPCDFTIIGTFSAGIEATTPFCGLYLGEAHLDSSTITGELFADGDPTSIFQFEFVATED